MILKNHDKNLLPVNPKNNKTYYQEMAFTLPVTSREQRHEYKVEFDKYYNEYQQLHAEMSKARDKFKNLQYQLKLLGSNEEHKYQEIHSQILREYEKTSNSISFMQKRQRFDYLHEKLSTIKRLVNEFDIHLRNQRREI
ncbi:hypothetical protein PVAND_004113 [Polypedilum vanderplanki]|uniref:OCEL domain-containing protein n=1 Tax=Polypedilum vanderplanki TaxID=319348 RepID=A0A9J6BWQ7_POLVA|nr:hypothetical protein PVAND_004113 [Polypedilum vanderplanki]